MKIDSYNSNLNLRHLRAIHAVWREGSFAQAAMRLGVVPSALTTTIQQVETMAGGLLFDRRTRPPKPTPLGLDFLENTRPVLEQLDQALDDLRKNARSQVKTLRIGASPSAVSSIIAPALTEFRRSHPDIVVTLHDEVAEALARMVVDDQLDLAIAGRARTSPDLIQTPILKDKFGIACRSDHPFSHRGGPIQLYEIDPESVIHLSKKAGSAMLLSDAPSLPPALKCGTLQTHSTISQLCLVRAGVGVALLPRMALELFNDPEIRFVDIEDFNLERHLYLLLPAGRTPAESAERFLRHLKKVMKRPPLGAWQRNSALNPPGFTGDL